LDKTEDCREESKANQQKGALKKRTPEEVRNTAHSIQETQVLWTRHITETRNMFGEKKSSKIPSQEQEYEENHTQLARQHQYLDRDIVDVCQQIEIKPEQNSVHMAWYTAPTL